MADVVDGRESVGAILIPVAVPVETDVIDMDLKKLQGFLEFRRNENSLSRCS